LLRSVQFLKGNCAVSLLGRVLDRLFPGQIPTGNWYRSSGNRDPGEGDPSPDGKGLISEAAN